MKDIKEEYPKSDHVVDMLTEEFIIRLDEDSSGDEEDDLGDSDDKDAASEDDRSSPEPGPSKSKRPCRDSFITHEDLMEC